MKTSRFLCLLALFLFGCTLAQEEVTTPTEIPLSQFVIGRWRQTKSNLAESGSSPIEYQLEFIDHEKLIYNEKSNQSRTQNLVFHYEFIGKNRIRIESRLITEWNVSKVNENLAITPSDSFGPKGVLERAPMINWPSIALLLFFAIIGSGVAARQSLAATRKTLRHPATSEYKTSKASNGYWPKISAIAFLGTGIYIGTSALNWWANLFIRLPWDTIIFLEVCGLALILSITAISVNKTATEDQTFQRKWRWNLGFFILGISVGGIIVSLIKLTVFAYLGSYGFGA